MSVFCFLNNVKDSHITNTFTAVSVMKARFNPAPFFHFVSASVKMKSHIVTVQPLTLRETLLSFSVVSWGSFLMKCINASFGKIDAEPFQYLFSLRCKRVKFASSKTGV